MTKVDDKLNEVMNAFSRVDEDDKKYREMEEDLSKIKHSCEKSQEKIYDEPILKSIFEPLLLMAIKVILSHMKNMKQKTEKKEMQITQILIVYPERSEVNEAFSNDYCFSADFFDPLKKAGVERVWYWCHHNYHEGYCGFVIVKKEGKVYCRDLRSLGSTFKLDLSEFDELQGGERCFYEDNYFFNQIKNELNGEMK